MVRLKKMAHVVLFFLIPGEYADFTDVAVKKAAKNCIAEASSTSSYEENLITKDAHNIMFFNLLVLEFSPNHLIDNTDVALNDFHHLSADIFVRVVWNRCAIITVLDKFHGSIN